MVGCTKGSVIGLLSCVVGCTEVCGRVHERVRGRVIELCGRVHRGV